MVNPTIYRSPEGQAEMMVLYDKQLLNLGIKYESKMIETRFGLTHVLITGPEDASPLFVFQGGNVTNPHDLKNILPLSKKYRIYAPDTIGHPERSAQTLFPRMI